jgi:cell division protein FtsW (lipid II flippase)
MDIVLDTAFVLVVVAFLKKQFILDGNVVLVVAFLIALAVAAAPLIGGLVPAAAPWIKVLLDNAPAVAPAGALLFYCEVNRCFNI